MPSPFTAKDPVVPARAEAQQRSRLVPRAQARVRASRARADDRSAGATGPRSSDVRARARLRSEGVALSHLPRHAIQRGQVAAQDARRRALSDARLSTRHRGRTVLRDCAAVGVDGRRHLHAELGRPARNSRAHRRHASRGFTALVSASGVHAPDGRHDRRAADSRAARLRRRTIRRQTICVTNSFSPAANATPRSPSAHASTASCWPPSAPRRRSCSSSTRRSLTRAGGAAVLTGARPAYSGTTKQARPAPMW